MQNLDRGGLWNHPRAPRYSREAVDTLTLRREEAMLTCLQRQKGCKPTRSSSQNAGSETSPAPQCKPRQSRRRSSESCRAGNSYEREKFHPGPKRDLEEEKRKLQKSMAGGRNKEPDKSKQTELNLEGDSGKSVGRGTNEEPTTRVPGKRAESCNPDESEQDERYQEVLNEIEERRQFLADMAALGQERQYVHIINAEISQRLRELDMLDQAGKSKQKTEDSLEG